jgi:UDP-N-acetylmuramate dehydrogenase
MYGNFTMSLSSDFDDILESGVRLGAHVSYGIGGEAEFLARPRTLDELCALLRAAADEGSAVRVLGGGSNLLVADEGVSGLVVMLAGKELASLELLPGAMRCGAGVKLRRLVREAADAGLSGAECLAGIPGTVGGALVMNAGGRYGSIGDLVRDVRAVDSGGQAVHLTGEQAGFGYRCSKLEGLVLTGCTLELTAEQPEVVKQRSREVLNEKRAAQPLSEKSAGCVFRNPANGPAAGELIDAAGFKGRVAGGAMVSEAHANFILNTGDASCSDVLELVDAIRDGVERVSGVRLELEIEIWS